MYHHRVGKNIYLYIKIRQIKREKLYKHTWTYLIRLKQNVSNDKQRISRKHTMDVHVHRVHKAHRYRRINANIDTTCSVSFYFSVSHLEKELAGKQKLLSGVCLRLVNIGIHVDHLTHRIREKRVQLENHRLQNKQVVERYGELNQQLNSYLNTVLIDQVPNEDVQLKIPSI